VSRLKYQTVINEEPRLPAVGEVESAVEVGLVRAASEARLRQSVLRSAFEGRLS
jgi:hypothetical protein